MTKLCRTFTVSMFILAIAITATTAAFAKNDAIARLNYAELRKRANCTATLISANAVLTARHCVVNRPIKGLHLVFGYARGKWVDHRRVRSVYADEKRDIAIACLDRGTKITPVNISRSVTFESIRMATAIGYKRSKPHLPSRETCSFRSGKYNARFGCKLEPGMSGAPVIWNGEIVGVVSGTTNTFSVIELAVDLPEVDCSR